MKKHPLELIGLVVTAIAGVTSMLFILHQIRNNEKNFELAEKRIELEVTKMDALLNEKNGENNNGDLLKIAA